MKVLKLSLAALCLGFFAVSCGDTTTTNEETAPPVEETTPMTEPAPQDMDMAPTPEVDTTTTAPTEPVTP